MADEILTSVHGRKLGIGRTGQILADPTGAGAQHLAMSAYTMTAAGTALTNTVTETALGSYTIPANRLAAGSVIKFFYQGIATATNSTDTLAIKFYIGGIGGTALVTHAAVDVANNDLFWAEGKITVRTIGSSGTLVGFATYKTTAAEGTATIKDDVLASTTIDTTATQALTVSGTWSVANAGNSCRLDQYVIQIL